MPFFQKKPIVVEARLWIGPECYAEQFEGWLTQDHSIDSTTGKIKINTLEGTLTADVDDMIIKGVIGEFYPCKKDVFIQTYEPILKKAQ